jgi:hypothetical protein
MKCFELKNDTLREGLLIEDDAGLPRINLSSDKKNYLEFDNRLKEVYQRAPKIAPIRMHYLSMSKDKKRVSTPRRNDRLALLVLFVAAGQGGDVTLSACSYQDTILPGEERVHKAYAPFPPTGVNLVTEVPPFVWAGGAATIELSVVMMPGASFRISRTGKLHVARPHTYLYWNGHQMVDTPKKVDSRTRTIPMSQEFTEEEREEIAAASQPRPAVEAVVTA